MLDDKPQPRPKPRIGAILDEAASSWHAAVNRNLAQAGAPQLGAGLAVLRQIPRLGIAQTNLSERLALSKQAVQQSLDQLQRLGLVDRQPDPADKRAKLVRLTDSGETALKARATAERSVERAIRDALGKKSLNKLRKALRKLADPAAD